MKRYDVYSSHAGPDEIEEHPDGDWVPADVAQGLYDALKAAIDCEMVPKSSARDGGAMKHVIQARVADRIRDALKAADGDE